jgi:hypothetical protein
MRSFKLAGKMNEAKRMRVMVSLNLADIMTATCPTTPQPVCETPNNETDAIEPRQESQLPTDESMGAAWLEG